MFASEGFVKTENGRNAAIHFSGEGTLYDQTN